MTHLYENLTGNSWKVHGNSKYCCFSIYRKEEDKELWEPLVVNECLWDKAPKQEESDDNQTFTWA